MKQHVHTGITVNPLEPVFGAVATDAKQSIFSVQRALACGIGILTQSPDPVSHL